MPGSEELWGWVLFHVLIFVMLALDLGVFHRRSHTVSLREACSWSFVWIFLALCFNGVIYAWKGPTDAINFLTGYLIEKSLSVDNLFVFAMVFAYFRTPPTYQHKVLFWGIVGALLMRAAFIMAGVALVQRFHWLLYILGAFLVYTGFKLLQKSESEIHPERNPILRLFRRFVPITPDYVEDRFFVRQAGKLAATPLFLVLLFVEMSDVVFAVDSIPAIMGVTLDPFIVYTSNVMAILGLRSLYFALAGVMRLFRYLDFGLAAVLMFIGGKMVAGAFGDQYHVPTGASLAIVGSILALSIAASLLHRIPPEEAAPLVEEEHRPLVELAAEATPVPDEPVPDEPPPAENDDAPSSHGTT